MSSSAVMVLIAIPSEVIWSYFVGGVVLAIGLVAIFLGGDWQKARGLDKLILFGPLFYAAPLAAFGTEHFTLTQAIASIMPAWIPRHQFWVYFVGACFIAAALSLVTRIQARLSASLLALTFLLFVVLMHAPGWAQNPRNRFALTVALREISFSGGALALAASLSEQWRERGRHIFATIARYFVAIPTLFFSFEQFMHGNQVPGIPLKPVTPEYVSKEEQAIFSHVQQLLKLRREHGALRRGQLWHIGWDQTAYAFARITGGERLLVILNRDEQPHSITLKFGDTPLAGARALQPLLGGHGETVRQDEVELKLSGLELRIYSVQ